MQNDIERRDSGIDVPQAGGIDVPLPAGGGLEHPPHPPFENRWPDREKLLFTHGLEPLDIQIFKEMYIAGQGAFFGQARKSGIEWQFDHGWHVAENLLIEWLIKNPFTLGAALLHDIVEDTDAFRMPGAVGQTHEEILDFAGKRLTKRFSGRVGRYVTALSKPEENYEREIDPIEAVKILVRQLEDEVKRTGDPTVIVIKLEDRIVNLKEPINPWLQVGKIRETEEYFMDLFRKLLTFRSTREIAKRRLARLEELMHPPKVA